MEQKKRRMQSSTTGGENPMIGTTSRSKATAKRAQKSSANYSALKEAANSQIYDQKISLQMGTPTPREKGRGNKMRQPMAGIRGRADLRQGDANEARRKDSLDSQAIRQGELAYISDDYLKIRDQLHMEHWNLDNQLSKLKVIYIYIYI